MAGNFELRGVPRRIARDGWWLSTAHVPDAVEIRRSDDPPAEVKHGHGRWWQVLLIVGIADYLFWAQRIGLSLAIFVFGLVLIAGWGRPRAAQVRATLICLAGALPVVEHIQPLSLLFLALGLVAAIASLHGTEAGLSRLGARMAGFLLGLPRNWRRSLLPVARIGANSPLSALISPGRRASMLRDWAFPLGGSLVFLALLMEANPIFLALGAEYLDLWQLAQRTAFWAGIAVTTAPFLLPIRDEPRLPRLPVPHLPGLGLNMRSVLRGLLMFNALIGVQMVSDLAILIGGADLPAGMGHAQYAHRGAYPLLVTAMLAGIFALLARPFWHEHRLIRPLMLLWLMQNIVLTGAAVLRLGLYIDAYGLTYLRLYALIWMALVALALGLSILQMALDRSNGWLMLRTLGLGLATLYLCAFVNFAAIIVAQNVSRPEPDLAYVCDLGPMAAAAIPNHDLLTLDHPSSGTCAAHNPPRIDGWRDWGYRSWRVNRMVAEKQTEWVE